MTYLTVVLFPRQRLQFFEVPCLTRYCYVYYHYDIKFSDFKIADNLSFVDDMVSSTIFAVKDTF